MMSEARRLHPIAVLFNLLGSVREAIIGFLGIGFFSLKEGLWLFISFALIFLVFTIIISFLSWFRYTYRVEEGELRIEYGILIRKKRYISKNRIQSIDLSAGVIHRLFNLVSVQIETAGSGADADASLEAIKRSEGEWLRDVLKQPDDPENISTADEAEAMAVTAGPSEKISFKRLFLAGSTSGSIGVIFGFAAYIVSQIEQFLPASFFDRFFTSAVGWAVGTSVLLLIGLVLFCLLILWLVGIAGTMIKYGNFTITRNGDELFISRGLLEKKQLTIPLGRIQAVGIRESILRQPLGYATVYAEIAGGSLDKSEDFSTVLFPIMKRDEIRPFLEKLLPDYKLVTTYTLSSLPRRACVFYVWRAVWPFLLAMFAVWYFFPPFAWIPLIPLIASALFGFLRYKDAGIYVNAHQLVIRTRGFSRNTVILYHKRIQAFEKKQHKLQKIIRLATVKLSIIGVLGIGTHYQLKDLVENDANNLGNWYSYRDRWGSL